MTHIKNASDLFIEALEQEGVEYIYGIPGEENLDLLEAISKSNIKLILTRHEQAAAFMAATYGRLTGKCGVAISTLGPGATNFTTSAAYATLGGFPLLLITGQKPITRSKQGRFQIIDVIAMMKPITKLAKQIVSVDMVASSVREAIRVAEEDKPGCVCLEFPEDVSAEPVLEKTIGLSIIAKSAYGLCNPTLLNEAVSLIKNAKMPLVLIGSGCNRHKLQDELTQFIDNTGLMFCNSQMGKGAVPDTHSHFLGTTALSSGDYIHEVISKADVIINIGYDVVEKPPYLVENNDTKIIHINYSSAGVDNIYQPVIELVGDIGLIAKELSSKLGKLSIDYSYAKKVQAFLNNFLLADENNNSFPIKPQKMVSDIQKAMGNDGFVALDNGMYKLWFARHYKSPNPNHFLLDNALATMGAGLPSAMEIARLHPSKKVLAVAGDGGFMMNSQELETALRLKLNLVVLVINDSGYGMIKWKQNAMKLADFGLNFSNPSFVKYAESYGAKGYRIEKTEDFLPTLEKCFKEKGVCLIDLPIDYSENEKVLITELLNKEKI
jgi:acetolactate synthase-1/2/3 large subunit